MNRMFEGRRMEGYSVWRFFVLEDWPSVKPKRFSFRKNRGGAKNDRAAFHPSSREQTLW